jgi:hypothetical protein
MLSQWSAPITPASGLARYRTLSPLAGVRVSPIQLGAMSIGDKWTDLGMGSMDKESSFKLLDAYFDLGVSQSCISWRLLQLKHSLIGQLH